MVWFGMKARCYNPNHISYKNYGARGIRVSEEFQSFESFYSWAMSSGYKEGLTLEREKNELGYSPENCKWADRVTQSRNSRRAHRVEFNGKNLCLSEWEEVTGIKAHTIKSRLKMGWTIERALTKGKTK